MHLSSFFFSLFSSDRGVLACLNEAEKFPYLPFQEAGRWLKEEERSFFWPDVPLSIDLKMTRVFESIDRRREDW